MEKTSNHLTSRQLKSIKTRQNLLEAAREVFLTNGFQKATISQINQKAKTGYGTAYVHFKNKDDILIVLMEGVMNRFYEIAELSFEPKTRKEAYNIIREQVGLFLEMAIKEQPMLQVVEEAIRFSEAVRQKWQEIRERFIQRIAKDVAFAQKKQLARTDVDSTLVARGWFFSNEMYLWEIVKNEHRSSINDIVYNLTVMYTTGLYEAPRLS